MSTPLFYLPTVIREGAGGDGDQEGQGASREVRARRLGRAGGRVLRTGVRDEVGARGQGHDAPDAAGESRRHVDDLARVQSARSN